MKREDFFLTKPLEEAVHKILKNPSGDPVKCPCICCMRLIISEESVAADPEFKIFDLLPCHRSPRNFNNIKLTPLYKNVRPISTLKHKNIMEL